MGDSILGEVSESIALSDRNRVRSTGGQVRHQACVCEGYVASEQSPSQKGAQSYDCLYAESVPGRPSFANLQTNKLKLAHGVI